jgi:RNA 2',3'-cyclic 3'-phosphodiesterase
VNLSTIVEMVQTTIDAPYGDIKWVFGKNLHMTISFLGNLDEKKINELSQKLETLKFGSPFNCVLTHTGIFPDAKEPRVFWLGIDRGKDRVIGIVEQINNTLKELEFPVDDKIFIPHVTIGRVKNKENVWKIGSDNYLNAVFSPTRFPVNSVHLYQSELTQQGVKFTTIVSNNLQ